LTTRSLAAEKPGTENRNLKTNNFNFGPHLALLAVQVIFGTWPVAGKIALRALPSTGLVALRVAGAALAFLLLRRMTGRLEVPSRPDLWRLALYSLLGVVLNQFLFVKGLALSTVVNAALLGTAIPVFTLLVGAALGRERLTARSTLGTAVAASGVIYLVDPLRADFTGGMAAGNLLLVLNTAAYGAYLALSQDVFRRYGSLTALTWVFALGSLAAVPLGGFNLARAPLSEAGTLVWLTVVYIVLVPTVGAYYLNAWALERTPPSTVAVYTYLQPLVAFAAAPLLLGPEEGPRAGTWAAAALIFTGVAVVTLRRRGVVMEEVSERPDALGR
jgi:drug/metabolite transporter (DMT)-like permease